MNQLPIVPLCLFSKPCFTVCNTPTCRQKPFICGYQGCRCQLAHQKCQTPLNWKQVFDAIKMKGCGTPELKAYFDQVSGTIQKNINELMKQKDKLLLKAMSLGLQSAQKDLANAVLSSKFDLVSPALVHQAVEELKYPSIPLKKTKGKIDSEMNNLNKHFEQLTNDIRQLFNVDVPTIDLPDSMITSNTSSHSFNIPTINTIPPGLEATNPKPLQQQFQPPPQYQQPQRQFQPLLPNQQPQRPPQLNQTNVPPQSISISGALKDLSTIKQVQPQTMGVQSAPIVSSGPPMALISNPETQTNVKEQSDLKKFISHQCTEMQVQKKKHNPTDESYEFSQVNYLKLKGCSFIQAKLLAKYFKNLTRLSLYNCNISKEGGLCLASLNKLIYLDITGNTIGDAGLKAISEGIPALEVLGLTGNEITDAGAEYIATNLKSLTELRLAYNKVTEKGAIKIAENCQKLNSLDINNSKFSEEAKQTIRKLLPKRHISL